jgi:hypothetical protein
MLLAVPVASLSIFLHALGLGPVVIRPFDPAQVEPWMSIVSAKAAAGIKIGKANKNTLNFNKCFLIFSITTSWLHILQTLRLLGQK